MSFGFSLLFSSLSSPPFPLSPFFPPIPLLLLLLLLYLRGYIEANLACCFPFPRWAESHGHDITNPSRIAFLRRRKEFKKGFLLIIFSPFPYPMQNRRKLGREGKREKCSFFFHIIDIAWLLASQKEELFLQCV